MVTVAIELPVPVAVAVIKTVSVGDTLGEGETEGDTNEDADPEDDLETIGETDFRAEKVSGADPVLERDGEPDDVTVFATDQLLDDDSDGDDDSLVKADTELRPLFVPVELNEFTADIVIEGDDVADAEAVEVPVIGADRDDVASADGVAECETVAVDDREMRAERVTEPVGERVGSADVLATADCELVPVGDSDGETVTVEDTDLVRAPEEVAKVDTVIDGELDDEGLDEAVIVEVHVLAAEDEDVDDNEIDPDVVAE